MTQELFNIEEQGYHNTRGVKIDTFSIVLIRLIDYKFFSSFFTAYVEKRNSKNELLEAGFNVEIPTEDWGTDDFEAVKAVTKHEKVDCVITAPYVIEDASINIIESLQN